MKKQISRMFGAFHNTCANDPLRPQLCHAMIDENGSIWATDSYVLIKSDLDIWGVIEPNSIEHAKGKALHRDKLEKMNGSKVKCIVFVEEGVELYYKPNSPEADLFLRWDAKTTGVKNTVGLAEYIFLDKEGKEMTREEEVKGKKVQVPHTFVFPNFNVVIEKAFFVADAETFPVTDEVAISAVALATITDAMTNAEGVGSLWSGVRLMKFREDRNRPVMVLPSHTRHGDDGYLKQFGLMMPIITKD